MAKAIQTDLTKGHVSRRLMRYALPIVAANLLQSVYNIVDMVIAGHFIGSDGISAIGNAGLVSGFLTSIAIGFAVGGNVLIGQYFGSGEEEDRRSASGTLFSFCIGGGLLIGLIVFFSAEPILRLLGAPALAKAVIYLRTVAVSLVFVTGYNGLSAILRAMGNSKAPMVCIVTSTVTNVALDLLFVAGLDMGVFGAALATAISQCTAFLLALGFVLRHRAELGFYPRYLKADSHKLRRIVKLGFPIALQSAIGTISWLAVMVLINKYGVDVSAGNGVSNKIKEFCQVFIAAMQSAAATMAAQNLGVGEYDRAKSVMRFCLRLTLLSSLVMIGICQLFAPALVSVFTDESAAADAAVANLRIEIVAQVFYAGFMSFNVLALAAGDTGFVMWNSFLNCIVVRIVLAVLLEHFFGIRGVYIACAIAPSVSVPVGYFYYRSGKWKKRLTGKIPVKA